MTPTRPRPSRRVRELEARLAEAEEALRAIRGGEVDAIVVYAPHGERVFTLRGAEHSYRVLVEAMSEGAATVDEGGVILYCNAALARLVGRDVEQVMGTPFRDLVVDGDRGDLDALAAVGRGAAARAEVLLRNAAGAGVPAYLSASAMEEDGRRLLSVVATDLSAQKRAQEVLAAERLARSIVDQAAEAIVVCTSDGIILRASRSAAELAGRNPLLAAFPDAFPLQLPAYAGGPAAIVEATRAGETLRGVEARLGTGDAHVDLLVSAAPLVGARGEAVGAVVSLTDVSERRRAEAERERLLGRVEALVAELRSALAARDDFMSVASHELKTPLTALALHIDGLRRAAARAGDELPERVRQRVDGIARQGSRLQELVNELLDVARIRAGQLELRRDPVELGALVSEVVDRFRAEARSAGCAVGLEIEAVDGVWDRSRLDQVVTNLVSNALKYGRGHPVSIAVRGDDGRARLTVADGGIGIHPDHQERIFQRFERAVSSSEFTGMGLGLWITREIVLRLGGTIRVESAPGAGATFTVELPRTS